MSETLETFVSAQSASDLTVVIVNYNTAHLLERCISHLRKAIGGLRVQLIIVDNASRDGSAAFIRVRFPDATLIQNEQNVGFGRANNQALALSTGRAVMLLNADAYVFPETLQASLRYLDGHADCGVLGVRSVDEHGQEIFTGRAFPSPWKTFVLQTGLFGTSAPAPPAALVDGAIECDWVVGCCYLVRREVIDRVGLFDPRYFLYFEEVDHCLAVRRAGWSVRCLLDARVVHVGGGSAATEGPLSGARQISAFQTESSLLFFRKHGGVRGVAQAALLALAADAILALKWLLKRRPVQGLAVFGRNMGEVMRLLVATRAGARPTR